MRAFAEPAGNQLHVVVSSEDLAYVRNDLFPFPHADQIVLSVNGKRVEPRRLFRRNSRDAEFVAMTLSAEHA